MLDTIDDVIVDAYNIMRDELASTKQALVNMRVRDVQQSMTAGTVTQVIDLRPPAAEPEKEEPEHGKPAASGSGYRYSRITKRFESPENLDRSAGLASREELVRQLADVRAKNTELEIANRELRSKLTDVSARNTILDDANRNLLHRLREWEARSTKPTESYTQRCARVVADTHGWQSQGMIAERAARFLEEALELAQACGMSIVGAGLLLHYVFHRPPGSIHQEIGGVKLCLGSLAACCSLDEENCGETELKRCKENMEKIRQKGRDKPKSISPFNAIHS